MCFSVGRAVPIKVGATGTPTVAAVFADGDLGVRRVVGPGYRTKLAPDRELPADVWPCFQEGPPLAQRQQVQPATLTCWKSWTVEKDSGAVDPPRLATRQFALGNMIRMFFL